MNKVKTSFYGFWLSFWFSFSWPSAESAEFHDRESDRGKVLVNETFLAENGMTDPIGATFSNPRRH
jgi:hypothetical protein